MVEEEMAPPLSGSLQAGCTSSPQEIVNSLGQAVEAEVATLPASEPHYTATARTLRWRPASRPAAAIQLTDAPLPAR